MLMSSIPPGLREVQHYTRAEIRSSGHAVENKPLNKHPTVRRPTGQAEASIVHGMLRIRRTGGIAKRQNARIRTGDNEYAMIYSVFALYLHQSLYPDSLRHKLRDHRRLSSTGPRS